MTTYLRPNPGTKCEEASPLSQQFYVPCDRVATRIVKNRDPQPYAMCDGCGDHNVRNRGASYVMEDGTLSRDDPSDDPFPSIAVPESFGRSLIGAVFTLVVVVVFTLVLVMVR